LLADSNEENSAVSIAPLWMNVVDEVNLDMMAIKKKKLETLAEKHTLHLMPGRFEDNESQDEVEILTAKITEMITKSKNKVKRIENEQVVNPQEQQIKKNLQMSLATQLQDLATGFKKSQKDYFDRLKGKQAKLQQFDPVDDGYNSTPQDINTGMTQRQLDTIQVNHELIQQRNEELKKYC